MSAQTPMMAFIFWVFRFFSGCLLTPGAAEAS
jgi:hypothetical protein